jgi:hypothetical protein
MGKELEGLTASLASPAYGPIDPDCQKSLRVAMMSASNHGLHWAGDISTNKQKFSSARNMAAQEVFDNPSATDGIVWVDSDQMLEADSILRLLSDMRANKLDFVCGIYHKKAEPFDPTIYYYLEDLDKYTVIENYSVDPPFCAPIGACGFGMVWTSTKLIQTIAAMPCFDAESGRWFPDTRDMPEDWVGPDGRPGFGEDFSFCDKARRAGFQLYVDTGVCVGHKGDGTIFDRRCYLQWLEAHGGHLHDGVPLSPVTKGERG